MNTLRDVIHDAEKKKVAVGHFNISNIEGFHAIVEAARELTVPVIIGLSEGEREFFGMKEAVALTKRLREEEGMLVFVNADHTYTIEGVKQAIDDGVDAAIFDGAKLSLEENIAKTAESVEYARATGRDVLIEGEMGYIGSSSKELESLPEGVTLDNLTTPEDAARFVKETGVDLFAPAIGNVHGMLKNAPEPRLHPDRVAAIRATTGVPLVLHGASGNTEEDIRECINAGVRIVHINTEIRVAFRDALKKEIADNPNEVAPYKITDSTIPAMKAVVLRHLKLFNNLS